MHKRKLVRASFCAWLNQRFLKNHFRTFLWKGQTSEARRGWFPRMWEYRFTWPTSAPSGHLLPKERGRKKGLRVSSSVYLRRSRHLNHDPEPNESKVKRGCEEMRIHFFTAPFLMVLTVGCCDSNNQQQTANNS